MRLLYIALSYLLLPFVLLGLAARAVREREYLKHWGERLGGGPDAEPGTLWLHAVSAGEVQAAAPLVALLLERWPQVPLVVTTTTPAGRARAETLYRGVALVRYLPLDLPHAVARFLDGSRPCIGILMETELWPSLYHAAAKRGIPLLIASARLSQRSLERWRHVAKFAAKTLEPVTIAAQGEADAERFRALGAEPSQVFVTGNLKLDLRLPAELAATGRALRELLGRERFVWVAGSTHEGEEQQLLEAHRRLRSDAPDALLILAPRHRPRFPRAAQLIRRAGLAGQSRTGLAAGAGLHPDTAVLLLDSQGELLIAYAAADVAFVGGSLVKVGGHNPLEAAAMSIPVLMGPRVASARDSVALLEAAGALRTVQNADELHERLEAYRRDGALRAREGAAGRAALLACRGVAQRLAAIAARLVETGGATGP
jgi:3-deoxy-D-manno-octulosonic-acid transferase